jgi:hypothetical protein
MINTASRLCFLTNFTAWIVISVLRQSRGVFNSEVQKNVTELRETTDFLENL